MEQLTLKSTIMKASMSELTDTERTLVETAIEATHRSYARYSHFSVGAALLLENGTIVPGCNQENAAFPVTICAERSALFAAGAQHPDSAVLMMAIAARNADGQLQAAPISPCGSCRQAIIETEQRYQRPIRLLLYGTDCIYIVDDIRQLMPLTFSEF